MIKIHTDCLHWHDDGECDWLKNHLQRKKPLEASLKDIKGCIERSSPICPAVFEYRNKQSNWKEQQFFLVYIDNKDDSKPILTPKEALRICLSKKIQPAFYYPTINHTESKPKFTIAFVCEEIVIEANTRAAIMDGLISLFNQSDTSCRNVDKVFLGTNKKAIPYNLDARFKVEDIINLSLDSALNKIADEYASLIKETTKSFVERVKKEVF